MRTVKGLPSLLLCPFCFMVSIAWEVQFHPKQERLIQSLPSYQIVTPARVNDFGERFPHTHHYHRRKRDADEGEPPGPRRAHYHLNAYGHLFQLNLSADANFIAATYNVQYLGERSSEERGASAPRHCFYSGHVNGQPTHTAVLSLCGGLMGTFRVHNGEYFVEPLLRADGSDYEDEHNKPHLVYRNEELKDHSKRSRPKPCEASEKDHSKKSILTSQNSSKLFEDLNLLQETNGMQYSSNMSAESNISHSHTRTKRFLSYPRYVELMVTADSKMVRHHGRNLQHYILTLMSILPIRNNEASVIDQCIIHGISSLLVIFSFWIILFQEFAGFGSQ